ncbi:MAG: type II secretion system F family protein [Candidatus Saccharimonadales bacterium]
MATKKIVHSTVEAESEAEAGKLLMSRNLVPLDIVVEGKNENILSKLTNRVTTKDRVIFSRQLATLINAGLPLSQSLHTAMDQTNNKKLKAAIQAITNSVEGGSTLAAAFEKHAMFDELYIALIAAGEVSGTLDKALERIATQQEKDAEIMSKVQGAMVYPGIVLLVIGGVILFMLTTVVPQVETLYASLNKDLPFLTNIMVQMASFVKGFWWLILIALGVGVFFFRRYLQTTAGKRAIDRLKPNLPLFGDLFKKLYMARFCRTGETLLMSGVPMLEMLRISGRSSGNVWIEDSILRAAEKVKTGKPLSSSLAAEDYILPLVPQMIGIGEQSGGVDAMMGRAASFYEKEVDNAIATISTAIEPLLMVVLAVVAGGMVGAILMPIYGLVGSN